MRRIIRLAPAEVAMDRLGRLIGTSAFSPACMAQATRGLLNGWDNLPDRREHAAQLRGILAAGLTNTVEHAMVVASEHRRQAQIMVNAFKASLRAIDDEVAR